MHGYLDNTLMDLKKCCIVRYLESDSDQRSFGTDLDRNGGNTSQRGEG